MKAIRTTLATLLPRCYLNSLIPTLCLLAFCSACDIALKDAVEAYERGDYKTALNQFQRLAGKGDSEAQYYLGQMYEHGKGVKKDKVMAMRWYNQALEAENANAQFHRGFIFYHAVEVEFYDAVKVEKDYREAIKWFRKAAQQNHAPAQFYLGVMYQHGEGVEQNDREAVKWYRSAAQLGNPTAQYNLGVMYEKGKGVEQNANEAAKWFRKAHNSKQK